MTTPPAKIESWTEPAARNYLAVGVAAAAVLGLALSDRGAGLWAAIVPLVAAAGLFFRWSSAPVFVVLGTAIALMVTHRDRMSETPTNDAVLAGACLGYCLGQFRLTGLTGSLFPADPRRPLSRRPPPPPRLPVWLELAMALTLVPYLIYMLLRRPRKKAAPASPVERRSGEGVPPDELTRALIAVVIVTLAVVVLWAYCASDEPPFSVPPSQWQLGLALWILLAVGLAARVGIACVVGRRQSLPEARMLLQETLWHETRREQRRGARWVAAAVKRRSGEG